MWGYKLSLIVEYFQYGAHNGASILSYMFDIMSDNVVGRDEWEL